MILIKRRCFPRPSIVTHGYIYTHTNSQNKTQVLIFLLDYNNYSYIRLKTRLDSKFSYIATLCTTSEELISGSLFVDSPDKFRILCFFFYFGISFAVHHHCSYKYTLVILIWTLLLMSTSSLNTIIQLYCIKDIASLFT